MEIVLQVTSGITTLKNYLGVKSLEEKKKKDHDPVQLVQPTNLLGITFDNLSYAVPLGFRKGKKEILHKISGSFLPGQLIAIIGPSEAGKTILLDILSGYRVTGVQGPIYWKGQPRNLNIFKKSSCYITCENHLHHLLTVRENMQFAAEFKLYNYREEARNSKIKQIISTLSLDECASTRVSCLSGGQQKRLSVALELIDNPMVMFLDEPTTGLDSSSCSQCLKHLRILANQGKTIVCTLQQLSAAHFDLFDQLYVMAEGCCLYQGATQNLIPFLESQNFYCPKYHNPADFVVELTSGEFGKPNIETMVQANENGRALKWRKETTISNLVRSLNEHQPKEAQTTSSATRQFQVLLKRKSLQIRRDATLLQLRIYVNIFIGLLYGMLYWQTGDHGGKVMVNYSLLYSILIHHMMSTLMLTILTFPKEMPILMKEHFNRWYSLKAYYAVVTVVDIPVLVLCCLIFTAIVYVMTNQPLELERVTMFTTTSILVVLVVQSFGLVVGSLFNIVNGIFIGFSMSIPMVLLAGFGDYVRDLPLDLTWISYLSFMKYAFEGIVTSIYGLNRGPFNCPADEFCQYKYPRTFLKFLTTRIDQYWVDLLGLCVMFVLYRIVAYVILRWRVMKRR